MESAVGSKLSRIVLRYGLGVCGDACRVAALLMDPPGEHHQEIRVLSAAIREGVPAELISRGTIPGPVIAERLALRLRNNLGLVEDAARWAVATWASALDVPGITWPSSAGDPQVGSGGPATSVRPSSVRPLPTDKDVRDLLQVLIRRRCAGRGTLVLGTDSIGSARRRLPQLYDPARRGQPRGRG